MADVRKRQDEKKTLLIVDDTPMNRALLSDILAPDYHILEAGTGREAVAELERHSGEIALVLLDVVMPDMDGFDLLTLMNKKNWLQSTPVIMISAEDSAGFIDRAYDLGATDYITRPFDEKTVIRRVQNTINLYAKQKVLEDMVTEQIMEKERSNFQMVEILSNIVEFRNGESGLHVRHVRVITDVLLQAVRRRCPEYGLTSAQITVIANASALHDVGKISIDEKILNKPGKLTPEEFEIMKTHTVIGAKMLEETSQQEGENGMFVRMAHDICRWHHERYDGRGYPDGLKGEEIPITAQVVALADVYDALTSPRVYKPAFSQEKAVQMILGGECGVFNPMLLECLKECTARLRRELSLSGDGGEINSLEIQRVTSELMAHGELRATGQTLVRLEKEHSKLQFFTALTHDILFEYDRTSQRITFSDWGAKYLGLPDSVIDQPDTCPELLALGVEQARNIRQRMESVTPMNPDLEGEYILTTPEGPKRFLVQTRALWEGEEMNYFCVLGKLSAL